MREWTYFLLLHGGCVADGEEDGEFAAFANGTLYRNLPLHKFDQFSGQGQADARL